MVSYGMVGTCALAKVIVVEQCKTKLFYYVAPALLYTLCLFGLPNCAAFPTGFTPFTHAI
jgi:hypothetical protein